MSNNQISAKTLFHFTKKFDNLLGILENGLLPSYCFESALMPIKVSSGIKRIIDYDLYFGIKPIGIPMVSFCDIRLSQISEHSEKFGSYGIGFKKDFSQARNRNENNWALNPVLYFENMNSKVGNILPFLLSHSNFVYNADKTNNPHLSGLFKNLRILLDYIKLYEGKIWLKDSKSFSNEIFIFYNEREWRYIPDLHDLGNDLPYRLNESYAYDEEKYKIVNQKLQNSFKLKIDFEMINYLIINKSSEHEILADYLFKKYGEKSKILLSKIISMEQIENDF